MREANKIIPVREQIADQLRSDIISGKLAPNTKLNEQQLANRFGVSRGPVRDVLLQLTKEGLLVAKNNCGVSVNSVLDPSMQELMIDIRRRIEVHAIRNLKGKLTEMDFAELEDILERLQDAFDAQEFHEVTKADIDFHMYLIRAAGGDELVNLWYPIVLRMRMNYKRISDPKDCVDEHRAILDALKANKINVATTALRANIK
ncbi:GntR family transcriptional regulator [Microbulbifer thermotolerans]|uniref:GntR family transcriptional regulator n=1 Tax=Microbulbifer thermotolerans TaxID=252514 RepID=A0A143HMD3_MICTH|nr:GntR family transcriptional regulator [Microbulbifer thermotolerans]AMX02874.1 GntR family transcriptional regulator [Microbulbifer thermotolerans]MCX2780501.1 GntR family transcriptional regulator [Microbulbifer thermotolerans]MCX2784100.1 GntR family transcriptional regulator [Microbulbifer thermotolerans]MCX2794869.1 GntR family transcriptional regulator [Microbulbifer thermotolerans]MCX2803061.1 GntR family transcriptional regulator [Microbulbifer thermotolerans]